MHPQAVGYIYPINVSWTKRRLQYSPNPFPRTPDFNAMFTFPRLSLDYLSVISGNPPPNPKVLLPNGLREFGIPPEYCARRWRSKGVDNGTLGVVDENLAAAATTLSVLFEGVLKYPGSGVEVTGSSSLLAQSSPSSSPKSDQASALAVFPGPPVSEISRCWTGRRSAAFWCQ